MNVEIIELYKKTHLPKKGWIQGCFCCKLPTSLTTHITTLSNNNESLEFNCFICKDCKGNFKKDKILYYNFLKDCKVYIYDKYYIEIDY
tara:strand:+ start:209 stop:475 length:267 start_codon:yes stop_codon:yes gene_type:complete